MRKLKPILLGLLLVASAVNVIPSCTKQTNSSENNSVDSVAIVENLALTDSLFFDSIYHIYINNNKTYEDEVVFDSLMTSLISEYSKVKGKNLLSDSKVTEYKNLVSFLTETFPDSLYDGTQADMNFASFIEFIEADYLNIHYEYLLTDAMPSEKLKELKAKEAKAWYDFASAQSSFQWNVLIDGDGGSCASLASNQLNGLLSSVRNEGNLMLYFNLHGENYKSKNSLTYKPIEKTYFDTEYAIYRTAIDQAEDGYSYSHTISEKLEYLKKNEESFNQLMELRSEISKELQSKIKSIFDQSTYRIQKIHLINLKNHYAQYGCTSSSTAEMFLREEDSYQKVLNSEHPLETPYITKKED